MPVATHAASRMISAPPPITMACEYRKNDQAWIEQKNGSVVRKLAGYGRLDGEHAVKAMNQMYMANRLFINFFQPSFKLLDTQRIGGKTVRRHDVPKTPYNRLIELHTCALSFGPILTILSTHLTL